MKKFYTFSVTILDDAKTSDDKYTQEIQDMLEIVTEADDVLVKLISAEEVAISS